MSVIAGFMLCAGTGFARHRDALASLEGPKVPSEEAVPILPEPVKDRARA